jgi:hypothetical protein
MGLLDDFGLSGLIQDATKIVKEVQTIKDEVVGTVTDTVTAQSSVVNDIKNGATSIAHSITSEASEAVADIKSALNPSTSKSNDDN